MNSFAAETAPQLRLCEATGRLDEQLGPEP